METRTLGRLLSPLARRLDNLLARAVVAAVRSGRMQGLQLGLRAGEVKDGVEHFEPYGFTAHPHVGAEAVVLFLGGDRSHGIAVAVADRRYRPVDLQPGEVAVFDDSGTEIRLRRGGVITVKAAAKVRLETPLLEVTGEIRDRCDADGRSMQSMREIYNAHTHPEPDGGTGVPHQDM